MSFSQELQDFATGFKASYHAPTEADRQRVGNAMGNAAGDKFAAAGPRSAGNLGTSWATGDTPGGATTPGAVPTGAGDGAEPSYNPQGEVPTFARTAGTQASYDALEAAKHGISGNESGGRYDALGPDTGGDRAYGKYQIMGKNIPAWTRAALGKAMTPQEFLNNPEAQEKTFEHRFGGYMAKYGPEGAAAAWFSGSPKWQGVTKTDVLGTRVNSYVPKFMAGFNHYLNSRNRAYAAGGVVEDDPMARSAALPVEPGNAEGRPLLDQNITNPQGMGTVIDAGADYMNKVFGLQPSAVDNGAPQNPDGVRAFAMNVGAAKPEEMQTIAQTVDPQMQMNPAMRAIAMYKGMYNYWRDHGEPEKAQRAIFAMTMAAKEAAHIYGTVALAAAQRGDTKIAADALAKAYDQVPDGYSVKVTDTSPHGARFEMEDINGNITHKGQIALDEMIRVATGMADGSEWLKNMGAIRTRTDKAGARAEADRQALENFNQLRQGKEGDKEFMSTLTPEERTAFGKLSPQVQRQLRTEFFKRTEAERQEGKFSVMQEHREREAARKQGNFETRMNVQTGQFEIRRKDGLDKWIAAGDERLEKRAHDDRIRAFETARKQNNWEKMREQVMSNTEKALALKERDLDDRNMRAGESLAARQKRHEEVDKRIMDQYAQRATARAAAPPKLTADERKQAAVNTTADTALTSARMNIPEMTGFDQPERQATFAETEGTLGAGRTYSAQEAARKGQPAVGDAAIIREEITNGLKASTNPKLSAEKQNALVSVASHIARANTDVDEKTASAIALEAGQPGARFRFPRDIADPNRTLVQVGNNQPVIMGSDALAMIAMIRGGVLRGATTGTPTPYNPTPDPATQRLTTGPVAEPQRPGTSTAPTGTAVPTGGVSAMNPVEEAKLRAIKMRADLENDKTRVRRARARQAIDLGERSLPVHGLYP